MNPSEDYIDAWERLSQMIRQGRSFSGRERNCAFLNIGDGRFADVSSAIGLDQIDDGRTVAVTDWDHDGDQDIWLANRTGPRVRLLLNRSRDRRSNADGGKETGTGVDGGRHHYLQLRLEGDPARRTPRDAIGARVEVHIGGATPRRLVRTLYGGDAYLSQSSKWLHFGLGSDTSIERVLVRWRGTEFEEFDGLEADNRYYLRQGQATAEKLKPRAEVSLSTRSLDLTPTSERARARLAWPLAAGEMEFESFSGKAERLPAGAVLVNLWATWCTPCLAELKEFSMHADELRKLGVTVLALNVDRLQGEGAAPPSGIEKALASYGPGLAGGIASAELVSKLDGLQENAVYRQRQLPVPSSFLLDGQRRLAAFYKGPLTVAQLKVDLASLSKAEEAQRADSVPFAGRRSEPLFVTNPIAIANTYMQGGYVDDAREYLERYLKTEAPDGAESLAPQAVLRISDVRLFLGRIAQGQGDGVAAKKHYEAVLELRPGFPPAANNLAWILATHPDSALRDGERARQLAQAAVDASAAKEVPPLDTLAAAFAELGRFEDAERTARQAHAIAQARGQTGLAQTIALRIDTYRNRQPFREERTSP